MTAMDDLTVIFEEQRTHLRAVAYPLLGQLQDKIICPLWTASCI